MVRSMIAGLRRRKFPFQRKRVGWQFSVLMKKKILLGIGIGFLAVIVIVVIVVGFFLGDMVKAGMETVGPKITQTTLTVDAVQRLGP